MLDLFKDASAQLKSAFKNVAWQENQKQEFLEHTQANTAKLEQEEREVDLELIRLEEGLEMVREEMRLLEEEEKELLDCERKRELGREGEPPKDGNLSTEKKSQVERGRFYNAGSSACVGKENLQTFVGGANKRKIEGDPHRSAQVWTKYQGEGRGASVLHKRPLKQSQSIGESGFSDPGAGSFFLQ